MNKEAFYSQLFDQDELFKIDSSDTIANQMVVVYQSDSVMPDAEAELLSKILDAVGKNINGIVLLNSAVNPVDCAGYKNCTMLLFGVDNSSVSLFPSIPYTFENMDGNQILSSDSLKNLSDNTELKMKLWTALKSVKV